MEFWFCSGLGFVVVVGVKAKGWSSGFDDVLGWGFGHVCFLVAMVWVYTFWLLPGTRV